MFVEQREQISEVWLYFHDIAFLGSPLLQRVPREVFSARKPSLPWQMSNHKAYVS
jgi:hypothetical protein